MHLNNLSDYMVGDENSNIAYELFAIVVHYGEFDGGHYVAKA